VGLTFDKRFCNQIRKNTVPYFREGVNEAVMMSKPEFKITIAVFTFPGVTSSPFLDSPPDQTPK
jgi:hypothetical protein